MCQNENENRILEQSPNTMLTSMDTYEYIQYTGIYSTHIKGTVYTDATEYRSHTESN